MPNDRKKIIRISTVPLSLKTFCKDLILEISDQYDVLAVSSAGIELDDLKNSGIATETVEMRREISPWADLKSLIRLIRLFRRHKPHMVHSITPKAGLLAMTAAWIARVPVRVHSFTGLVFPTSSGLKRKILMTTDKATCAFATHILPEGQGVRSDLLNHGITDKDLKVLGYGNIRGIDLNHYCRAPHVVEEANRLCRQFGIDPEHSYIYIYMGRIVGDKGINELAEAFNRVHQSNPEAHLVIAGSYDTGDPVSESTRQLLETHSNIHLTNGWIDDVRPYYAMAHALVFPSYREGFPNVVIEAGAMELPSVVTDINGSREIIANGHNGLIVPPRDAVALYEAMKRLADSPELTARLASTARDLVAERYEASFVRACLKDFYADTLNV